MLSEGKYRKPRFRAVSGRPLAEYFSGNGQRLEDNAKQFCDALVLFSHAPWVFIRAMLFIHRLKSTDVRTPATLGINSLDAGGLDIMEWLIAGGLVHIKDGEAPLLTRRTRIGMAKAQAMRLPLSFRGHPFIQRGRTKT